MPHSNKTSRIALLFTSSALARSLIRIFIRSAFPPSTRYTIMMTSRFKFTVSKIIFLWPAFPLPALPARELQALQFLQFALVYGLRLLRPLQQRTLPRQFGQSPELLNSGSHPAAHQH